MTTGQEKSFTTLAGHDVTVQFGDKGNVVGGQIVGAGGQVYRQLPSKAVEHLEIGFMAAGLRDRAQADAQTKIDYLAKFGPLDQLRANAGFTPHFEDLDRYTMTASQMDERADFHQRAAMRDIDRTYRNKEAMAWLGGELNGIEIEALRAATPRGVTLASADAHNAGLPNQKGFGPLGKPAAGVKTV